MREVTRDRKYRAYHKVEKRMYYFNWETITRTKFPGYYNPIDGSKACELSDKSLYSEPMDFIGLLDRNGREIYEGDRVLFELPGFGISSERTIEWSEKGYGNMFEDYHRKIIGNIWEDN